MGATRTTVTGTARCWSSQTCVMPTFSPTIALVATVGRSFRSIGRHARTGTKPAEAQRQARTPTLRPKTRAERLLVVPQGPHRHIRRALRDVKKTGWARIDPGSDVTPSQRGTPPEFVPGGSPPAR